MLNEYAIEPELFDNWERFRYLIEKFGVENGRLISQYPLEWRKAVYNATIGFKPVQRSYVEECLRRLVLMSRNGEWNDELNWLENAIEEHSKRSFHAIISNINPNNHSHVLINEEIHDGQPLMQASRSVQIKRTSQEMALCVKNLFYSSKQIMFIDPHFSKANNRHFRPLGEFLKLIEEARNLRGVSVNWLEYHTDNKTDESFFKNRCDQRLPVLIPQGMILQIVRWPEDELHNRFILTDIGGVMFGTGLDDNEDGNSTDWEDVNLLDYSHYQELWRKHTGKQSFHQIIGKKS
jgi:hypothetical protein